MWASWFAVGWLFLAMLSPALAQGKVDAPKNTFSAKTLSSGKMRGSGSHVVGPRATVAAPLTADECTTLGGSTVSETACNSGRACETTTENGDWKRVCLSKAK